MKPFAIVLILVALAIIPIVISNSSEDEPETSSPGQAALSTSKTTTPQVSSNSPAPTRSSRKRQVTERPKHASWHSVEKGFLVSPYTNELVRPIGVISGARMKDSEGNLFIVPSFDDSPFPVQPIGAHIPDRPGYIFNPFTQNAVDIRGIPPNSLVRDPVDPNHDHKFRTPPDEPAPRKETSSEESN